MKLKFKFNTRKQTMKKLYSKFAESRVKQYLFSHEASASTGQNQNPERHLTTIPAGSFSWQSISARTRAQATTRWIE